MKIYKLPQLAEANPDGTYLLGGEGLKTGSAYLLYTRISPKETGRNISPRNGCEEEIIYMVRGSLQIRQGRSAFTVTAGEAFLSNGKLVLDNPNDEEAVYIAAGGCVPTAMEAVAAPAPVPQTHATEAVKAPSEPQPKEADMDDFEITREDGPGEGGE